MGAPGRERAAAPGRVHGPVPAGAAARARAVRRAVRAAHVPRRLVPLPGRPPGTERAARARCRRGRGQQHRLGPPAGLPRTRPGRVRGRLCAVVRARGAEAGPAAVRGRLPGAGRRSGQGADGRRQQGGGRRRGGARLPGAFRGPPARRAPPGRAAPGPRPGLIRACARADRHRPPEVIPRVTPSGRRLVAGPPGSGALSIVGWQPVNAGVQHVPAQRLGQ
ncbi:hypothetical protein SGPA1_20875 [Streptomyces misionensis JCM 4497]